jgi:hypothetical protein
LQKSIIDKAVFINLFYILPKILLSGQVSGRISGIRPLPDIRYPAFTGYPAGYPVSGFWIRRISGRPDIRQKQYPVHPYPKYLLFLPTIDFRHFFMAFDNIFQGGMCIYDMARMCNILVTSALDICRQQQVAGPAR